ncbi:hypothetical protein XI25_18045 [Paenibacillus sp. DMB20]|nr:hypothetical protein XI25_18045 [Paenibacillus sp. DMB20]
MESTLNEKSGWFNYVNIDDYVMNMDTLFKNDKSNMNRKEVRLLKIQSVNLLTDYLKEQEEFYTRTFGLTLVERTNKSFTVKVGRSFFDF